MGSDDMIGWDIGGAHLKAARISTSGVVLDAVQVPCALWRGLNELELAIDIVLARCVGVQHHAITMTGEMVDLFPDRGTGVKAIAEFVAQRLGGDVWLYRGDGQFVLPSKAAEYAMQIASANWRATAECVAQKIGNGILVDIGSTTTDIIPIVAHKLRNQGGDDATRLDTDELVYSGIVRTPLMAMAERVPFAGTLVPLVAEHFATMADVYRLTGELPEDADQHPTADGGEKTLAASARRLARMLGRDSESATMADWYDLAHWFRARQLTRLHAACERVTVAAEMPANAPIIGAGVGRFLIRELAVMTTRPYRDFADLLSLADVSAEAVSNFAPAVAVALLAQRR